MVRLVDKNRCSVLHLTYFNVWIVSGLYIVRPWKGEKYDFVCIFFVFFVTLYLTSEGMSLESF